MRLAISGAHGSHMCLKVLDFDIADLMDDVAGLRVRSVLPPRGSLARHR